MNTVDTVDKGDHETVRRRRTATGADTCFLITGGQKCSRKSTKQDVCLQPQKQTQAVHNRDSEDNDVTENTGSNKGEEDGSTSKED